MMVELFWCIVLISLLVFAGGRTRLPLLVQTVVDRANRIAGSNFSLIMLTCGLAGTFLFSPSKEEN